MTNILHVTNGDCTVERMRQIGIKGDLLPWRDVLHDGPVPAGDDLAAVSRVRAEFIANVGWAEREAVLRDFRERDARLARSVDDARIVLWFEHDLYDQLQLLQLLDWFSRQRALQARLFLIDHHDYISVIALEQLAALQGSETPVSQAQLNLARSAWQAFTADTPMALVQLLQSDTGALPHLCLAIERLLAFYPDPRDGLNRSERQALQGLANGIVRPDRLFEYCQEAEEPARFMGDSSFWQLLIELGRGESPLLETANRRPFVAPLGYPWGEVFLSQRLRLTEVGKRVLAGEQDALSLRRIDRDIGGTHLQPSCVWRWDAAAQRLHRPG